MKFEDADYVISIDAESNGLWGQAFSIAAVCYNKSGEEIARFIGRCPITEEVDPWVAENVLPQMTEIEEEYDLYSELLMMFFDWRQIWKDRSVELVHMGVPVEARLYLDAHKAGIIGDWEGPYPLIDCSAIPEIWDSVDSYNEKHGIKVDPAEFAGGTHNPLYDATAAALAYLHWMKNR